MGRKLNPEAKARLDGALRAAHGDRCPTCNVTMADSFDALLLDALDALDAGDTDAVRSLLTSRPAERSRIEAGGAYDRLNTRLECDQCNAARGPASGADLPDAGIEVPLDAAAASALRSMRRDVRAHWERMRQARIAAR